MVSIFDTGPLCSRLGLNAHWCSCIPDFFFPPLQKSHEPTLSQGLVISLLFLQSMVLTGHRNSQGGQTLSPGNLFLAVCPKSTTYHSVPLIFLSRFLPQSHSICVTGSDPGRPVFAFWQSADTVFCWQSKRLHILLALLGPRQWGTEVSVDPEYSLFCFTFIIINNNFTITKWKLLNLASTVRPKQTCTLFSLVYHRHAPHPTEGTVSYESTHPTLWKKTLILIT